MIDLQCGDKLTVDGTEYVIKEISSHGLSFAITVESAKKRWWFDPYSLIVERSESAREGWIEVAADYAAYLQAKPEGEWELRKVEIGDECFGRTGIEFEAGSTYADVGPTDRGYRWCKPRKVAAEPPRYVVNSVDGIKYVWDSKGRYAICHGAKMQDMWRISKAMNAIEASKDVAKDSEK